MNHAKFFDGSILKDEIETLARHFDRAEGIAKPQEPGIMQKLGLIQPMIGDDAPCSIREYE